MIKKVVIAAAGKGTRMLHLTKYKSKHLIKVLKRPFLSYLLDNLLKAGYKELILVVGYKSEKVKEFLKKYKYKVTLVNQFEILGKERYGTLCPVECVKDIIGNENFLAVYGDNLYSVKDLKAFNIDDNYNYVAGLLRKHPEKYGVLISDNGFLKEIIEKPSKGKYDGKLVNIGLYKFTPDVFKKIPKVKKSPRGEYELTDAMTLLAEDKKVKIKKLEDYWLDFGNPADIMKVSKFLRKSKDIKVKK